MSSFLVFYQPLLSQSALHFAVINGSEGMVELILRACSIPQTHIVVNIRDSEGWTALAYAIQHEHADIMEQLLNNGAAGDHHCPFLSYNLSSPLITASLKPLLFSYIFFSPVITSSLLL